MRMVCSGIMYQRSKDCSVTQKPAIFREFIERCYRRELVFYREPRDCRTTRVCDRRNEHDQCSRPLFERGFKSFIKIRGITQFCDHESDTKRPSGTRRLIKLKLSTRFNKDRDARKPRNGFFEKLDPFATSLHLAEVDPCNVATWPSNTGDKPNLNRVVLDRGYYNWDCAGCLQACPHRDFSGGEDQVQI